MKTFVTEEPFMLVLTPAAVRVWRQAIRTALNAQQSGDCGRIMIVLLTDGRANVSLAKSNEDPEACAEGAPRPTQARLALRLDVYQVVWDSTDACQGG